MTLYEQVVVDVKKVREEAMRYGETVILEKLTPKIEEAVKSILEQDPFEDDEEVFEPDPEMPDFEGGGDDLGLAIDDEEGIETDPLTDKLPLAATEGENLCQCPEEEEEVEINFNDLMKMDDEDPNMGTGIDVPIYESEELEEDLDQLTEEEIEEVDLGGLEEQILALAEEMDVDIDDLSRTGWDGVPRSTRDDAEDLDIVRKLQDDDYNEEYEETQKALKKLHKENRQLEREKELLEKKLTTYKSKFKKLKGISFQQQEKLSSLSDINTRLFYINEVLKSNSLNGRQKKKIVEKLERTETAEEAKLVFESLQSTVGSQTNKKPKSLREVAANVPQNFVARSLKESKEAQQIESSDGFETRWQKLAGIKAKGGI
jgi:hypothetical protein